MVCKRFPFAQIRSSDLRNSPSLNGRARSRLQKTLPLHQILIPQREHLSQWCSVAGWGALSVSAWTPAVITPCRECKCLIAYAGRDERREACPWWSLTRQGFFCEQTLLLLALHASPWLKYPSMAEFDPSIGRGCGRKFLSRRWRPAPLPSLDHLIKSVFATRSGYCNTMIPSGKSWYLPFVIAFALSKMNDIFKIFLVPPS